MFFEKIFLLANTNMQIVLGMFFLSFSNIDIHFDTKEFTKRTYTTTKAIPIARHVEFIDKYKFAKLA